MSVTLVSHMRAAWRAGRMLGHVLRGIATVWWKFPRMNEADRQQRVQQWAQQLLVKAGITLQVRGTPLQRGPALLVANHISWLDIPVLHAAVFCRFVSKDEVRRWPLIGRLATAAGTLYIARHSRRDAQRMVQSMSDSLRQGDLVCVFPEGTTSDGLGVLPFHSNLLQAAIDAQAPIQPVALRFVQQPSMHTTSTVPSYVGDESLLTSLWRTLRAEGLIAQVHFGPSELAQGRDRRIWSLDLHAQITTLRQP